MEVSYKFSKFNAQNLTSVGGAVYKIIFKLTRQLDHAV